MYVYIHIQYYWDFKYFEPAEYGITYIQIQMLPKENFVYICFI